MRRFFLYGLAFLLSLLSLALAQTDAARHGLLLQIEGAIGPATADYVVRGLQRAAQENAAIVVLRIDTPGGLSESMREIIQRILASPVPVVAYVYPSGARAASAGTYILYASHIAAMAPATHLGAATPVQIGPGARPAPTPGEEEGEAPPPPDAMTQKAVNDAVAYIRGLARLRGRNAEWAERAVREAATLDAAAAREQEVIDLVAADFDELLAQVDGRTVGLSTGERALKTTGIALRPVEPDWRTRLLAVISDPNVAYILMLIGIYGLIFEFASPGMIIPGVVGAICLLLALYAFQVLPINYAGLGLMLLGVALMVGEAFAPSFGALGIGGISAFVIGSVVLIDTDAPGFGVSLPLIAAVALVSAAVFLLLIGMAIRARHRPVVSGAEELIGAQAEAMGDFTHEGLVRAHGEIWRARSATPIRKGQRVRISARSGLTLEVRPEEKEAP